jgi:hypothetical protein
VTEVKKTVTLTSQHYHTVPVPIESCTRAHDSDTHVRSVEFFCHSRARVWRARGIPNSTGGRGEGPGFFARQPRARMTEQEIEQDRNRHYDLQSSIELSSRRSNLVESSEAAFRSLSVKQSTHRFGERRERPPISKISNSRLPSLLLIGGQWAGVRGWLEFFGRPKRLDSRLKTTGFNLLKYTSKRAAVARLFPEMILCHFFLTSRHSLL